MHLISALLCGIPGAANGTAELYQRGTPNRATWYEDFEGHGADSSGADIDLSSTGHAVVYVAELVEVVVKSSAGTTLRQWVDGVSANCVEVRAASFTGVDYDTAKSAAGNPTNLDAVLELWDDSAGAIDWEVGSGGTPLDDAVTAVAGIFYNVKAYGAVGDGVTNDATAIASAITAATNAGGGTVYFPPGTYLSNVNITQAPTVAIQGAGAGVSILRFSVASRTIFWKALIQDMTIDSSVNLTGAHVTWGSGAVEPLRLVRCTAGNETFSAAYCVDGQMANVQVLIESCVFNVIGATQAAYRGSFNRGVVSNCLTVVYAVTHTGTLFVVSTPQLSFVGGGVNYLLTTTGPSTVFFADIDANEAFLTVTGMSFLFFSGSPAATLFDLDTSTHPRLTESGNSLPIGINGLLYDYTGVTLAGVRADLGLRNSREVNYPADTTPITIDTLNYELIRVTRGNNAAQTVNFTAAPIGSKCSVLYHNDHAGAGGTITFDTTNVDMIAASNQFTVAANSYRLFRFESRLVGSNLRWCEMPMAAADEPE